MLQIIQDLSSGDTILEEVPSPKAKPGHVVIRTHRSLVSLGTERMLVEFGKANFIDKARQQPDKVKQVLAKVKTDGWKPTLEAVLRKLGEPLPLGYCNAGEVIEVGKGVSGIAVGDRVISNGHHAEVVCVPENLVAKIPENVSFDDASFTVIGAIALQGIRLLKPTFGETIVVSGLGLIGLVAVQLLKANGCKVIGLDFDNEKVKLAKALGIEAINISNHPNPETLITELTNNVGGDGVLITASTKSSGLISQAAKMSRKRGRIILVGVIGLDIQRSDFYEKELTFQVSCSYGPGRYDPEYETKGIDYPLPYVRWTEKRNFEAVLQAISTGQLNVEDLITERIALQDYQKIYNNMAGSKSIASILIYDTSNNSAIKKSIQYGNRDFKQTKGVLGLIGAGNFTNSTIAPSLKKLEIPVKSIASSGGLSGTLTAKKFGFGGTTTDYTEILKDPEIDGVIITTRHNQHAQQVIEALNLGKHVFVEKPLALSIDHLDQIKEAFSKKDKTLTVGFNRRFSPFALDAKKQLGENKAPINVVATMNAGYIPQEMWLQDMEIGGGRIIGEAVHLIDLITFFTGSLVSEIVMNSMGTNPPENTDNASILLKYENGSNGVINYFSNGSKSYSKERVEIFSQNRTMIIDNFRKSKYYGFRSSGLSKNQDKGHFELLKRWTSSVKNGTGPVIPIEEIMNTSLSAILAVESMKSGSWKKLEF
jgi:predicted dehydrogenase/threonine dehydrogenase-like Zn-dependent dehydrogenase